MKPHEETWEAHQTEVRGLVSRRVRCLCEFKTRFTGPKDPQGHTSAEAIVDADYARAKLAAQAPAMARLLLEVQYDLNCLPYNADDRLTRLRDVFRDAGVI